MKDKIIQALKRRYAHLGVGDKALDGVADLLVQTIDTEDKIEDGIGKAEGFLKAYQSDVDKERNALSKARKELEEYKKRPEPTPDEDKPKEMSAVEKRLTEMLELQQQQLAKLLGERTHDTKLAEIRNLLNEKNVPSAFADAVLSGRSFTDETNAEELAKSIEASYGAMKDALADNRFKNNPEPDKGDDKDNDPDLKGAQSPPWNVFQCSGHQALSA